MDPSNLVSKVPDTSCPDGLPIVIIVPYDVAIARRSTVGQSAAEVILDGSSECLGSVLICFMIVNVLETTNYIVECMWPS